MTVLSLPHITQATAHLREVLDTSCLLTDPEGIGNHLTCTEANALAGLLLAVGLPEHAASLVIQHADADTDDDDAEHVRLRDALRPMQATGYGPEALALALDAF